MNLKGQTFINMKKITYILGIIFLFLCSTLIAQENNEPDYLRINASRQLKVILNCWSDPEDYPSLQYRTNLNKTWQKVIPDQPINVYNGYIELKANGTNSKIYPSRIEINSSRCVDISGNIMTLLDETGELDTIPTDYCFSFLFDCYKTALNLSNLTLPATKLRKGCYERMFYQSKIENFPNNLPASILSENCYEQMFALCELNCEIPNDFLPATELAMNCYKEMFAQCTNLSIPDHLLPAQNLKSNCYRKMFAGSDLIYIPETLLPATKLEKACYAGMFNKCINLAEIPRHLLPATQLATGCYEHMFSDCNSLTTIPETLLPAILLSDSCYLGMFANCTNIHDLPQHLLPATTLSPYCYTEMFINSGLSILPTNLLPATQLAPSCYYSMFQDCIDLESPTELPATTLSDACYSCMFRYCQSLRTAPILRSLKLAPSCYSAMFWGCSSLLQPPTLPATELATYCYNGMFWGCSSLQSTTELPALKLTPGCYKQMFGECTSITSAPLLPAQEMEKECYAWMFVGCEKLEKIPDRLPALKLAPFCYERMFANCILLETAPELPATILDDWCYFMMFNGCKNLSKASYLPAKTLTTGCYALMFIGCEKIAKIKVGFTEWNDTLFRWPNYGTYYGYVTSTSNWLFNVAEKGIFILPTMTKKIFDDSHIPTGWRCPYAISFNPGLYGEGEIEDIYSDEDSLFILSGQRYTREGFEQIGWSRLKDGSSLDFELNDTFPAIDHITLYPVWANPNYLYLTAQGAFSFSLSKTGAWNNTEPIILYSIDKISWHPIIYGQDYLFKNQTVYFKTGQKKATHFSISTKRFIQFNTTGNVNVGGNIMTLIDATGNITTIPNAYCFFRLFYDCSVVSIAELELPATELKPYCYRNMFYSCDNLVNVSQDLLSAKNMTNGCYAYMFGNCKNLTHTPNLPSLNLADSCYYKMFSGCESLTTAPDLIATKLYQYCYREMFRQCYNLNSITVGFTNWLDTTLKPTYKWMYEVAPTGTFHAPTELEDKHGINYNPWPPYTITFVRGNYCTQGTSSITIKTNNEGFFNIPKTAMDFSRDGYVHIGWSTTENGDKEFAYNATNIYTNEDLTLYPVFEETHDYVGFTSKSSSQIWLTKHGDANWNAPIVEYSTDGGRSWTICNYDSPTPIPINNGDKVCFRAGGEKKKNETFSISENNKMVFAYIGNLEISGNIMTLLDGSEKDTTSVPDYCFCGLFSTLNKENSKLEDETLHSARFLRLPATKLGKACYAYMFTTNFRLEYPPAKLPATELSDSCYFEMFSHCFNLKETPYLPASKLVPYCYAGMFNMEQVNTSYYVPSLSTITVNFDNWEDNLLATNNWVAGITGSGKFRYSSSKLTTFKKDASHIPNMYWSPYTIDFIKEYALLKSISIEDSVMFIESIITADGTFSLSGATFYKYGYIQTGWTDGENEYKLTGTYITNHDLTLYPIWEMKTTIDGVSSICNDYQIETYTLTNINEQSVYQWTLSENTLARIISKTTNSVTIQTLGNGTGDIELIVYEYHDDLLVGEQTHTIHVNQRPTGSVAIEKDWISICPYATQTVSVQYDGAIHWELSNGITIDSVLNNNSITITTSDKNGYIKAYKQNGEGCIAYEPKTITIQINSSNCNQIQNYADGDIKPINIIGDKFICIDQYSMWNRNYSIIDRNPQCIYNWSLSENNIAEIATYSNGINGNITIIGNVGNEDLTLTVQEIKDGFVIRESIYPITIRVRPTFTNEQILGPNNVCPNEIAVEYAMSQPGEYYWYLSDGTEPIIGQGESTATFNFSQHGTNIFVKKQNGENCLSYNPLSIWVNTSYAFCDNLKSYNITDSIFEYIVEGDNDDKDTSIILYPIPAQHVLNILSNTMIESITIFSINGTNIIQENNNTTTIDISNLKSGTYNISIKTDKGIVNKNITIMK